VANPIAKKRTKAHAKARRALTRALGLPASASDADVTAAVVELSSKSQELKGRVKQLEARLATLDSKTQALRLKVTQKINKGLAGTPLRGLGRYFEHSGWRWNVNPALVAAISGVESSFCANKPTGTFNCWGYHCHSGKCQVKGKSYAQVIELVTRRLRQRYMDSWNKKNVLQIANTYAPASDGNNPPHWTRKVESWMVDRFGSSIQLDYPR
jgi:hypothetical protein